MQKWNNYLKQDVRYCSVCIKDIIQVEDIREKNGVMVMLNMSSNLKAIMPFPIFKGT